MDRRCFLLTSLAGALGAPLAAEAQQARVRRVGVLGTSPPPELASTTAKKALEQGLRELAGRPAFDDRERRGEPVHGEVLMITILFHMMAKAGREEECAAVAKDKGRPRERGTGAVAGRRGPQRSRRSAAGSVWAAGRSGALPGDVPSTPPAEGSPCHVREDERCPL
jgi:hypothetical protein